MINFPTANIARCDPIIERLQTRARNAFTGGQDIQDYGAFWRFSIDFVPLDRTQALSVEAFAGSEQEFLFGPQGYDFPTGLGTARVRGSSEIGSNVATDGWSGANTTVLLNGQWVEIGGQLNRLSADATTNGSNQVDLPLVIPQRAAPANNALVDYASPQGTFVITDVERPVSKGVLYSRISVQIEELYA